MRVLLGKLGSPFSLDGSISAFLYSDSKPSWSFAWLGLKEFKVFLCKYPHKSRSDLCICKIEGINNSEEVATFSGREFWIDRMDLPKLASDEVYLCDLIGLPVVRGEETVGHIVATHDFGAGIVLQVEQRYSFEVNPDMAEKNLITEETSTSFGKPKEDLPFKKGKKAVLDVLCSTKVAVKQDLKNEIAPIFIHWKEIDKIEQNRILLKN